MNSTNAVYTHVTLQKISCAKEDRRQALTKKEIHKIFKRILTHPIHNAHTDLDLPLSDRIHGPYRMIPPELLHTSGSRLTMYMFSTLANIMNAYDQTSLDILHVRMTRDSLLQSERDFPIGSDKNGIINNTKGQSTQHQGNLFCLICITHTTAGNEALGKAYGKIGTTQTQVCSFLMVYLAMEE
jgi:hypothetical protein